MKIAVTFFSFILLFSCNNNKGEKNAQPRPQLKDTSIARNESRINPYVNLDVSPMDMSYFPVDFPKLNTTNVTGDPLVARVIYSRPHLQGRELFHGLLNYGEPWRLGANESTEIQFFKPVTIQDKKVIAGRYILYCIPQEKSWTIAFNKNIDTWGLKPDSAKDAYRFDIPVKQTSNRLEYFTMVFEKTGTGADLLMAWDDVEARLPFTY